MVIVVAERLAFGEADGWELPFCNSMLWASSMVKTSLLCHFKAKALFVFWPRWKKKVVNFSTFEGLLLRELPTGSTHWRNALSQLPLLLLERSIFLVHVNLLFTWLIMLCCCLKSICIDQCKIEKDINLQSCYGVNLHWQYSLSI